MGYQDEEGKGGGSTKAKSNSGKKPGGNLPLEGVKVGAVNI